MLISYTVLPHALLDQKLSVRLFVSLNDDTGLSSDFSENMVFVDYSTSQEILNKSENNRIANKILMYSGSLESTELALNKLKDFKIDKSKYSIKKDNKAFEESLESVSGIKHIIKIRLFKFCLR